MQMRITVVFFVSGAPIHSFILQLPFSSIFCVYKWFSVYSLPLLPCNGTPKKSSLLLNTCFISLIWVQWQRVAFFWALFGIRYIFGQCPSQVVFCTSNFITIGGLKFWPPFIYFSAIEVHQLTPVQIIEFKHSKVNHPPALYFMVLAAIDDACYVHYFSSYRSDWHSSCIISQNSVIQKTFFSSAIWLP